MIVGFRVQGCGFMIYCLWFMVSGLRVQDLLDERAQLLHGVRVPKFKCQQRQLLAKVQMSTTTSGTGEAVLDIRVDPNHRVVPHRVGR